MTPPACTNLRPERTVLLPILSLSKDVRPTPRSAGSDAQSPFLSLAKDLRPTPRIAGGATRSSILSLPKDAP